MDNKKLGKIIIRYKRDKESGEKKMKAFFSPACCFTPEKFKERALHFHELNQGENIINCECGRKYRVTVNGKLYDFSSIVREEITEEKGN